MTKFLTTLLPILLLAGGVTSCSVPAAGLPRSYAHVDLAVQPDGSYAEEIRIARPASDTSARDEIQGLLDHPPAGNAISRLRVLSMDENNGVRSRSEVVAPGAGQSVAAQEGSQLLRTASAGDLIEFTIRRTWSHPLPDGQHSLSYFLRRNRAFGEGRVRLHIPAGLPARWQGFGFDTQKTLAVDGNTVIEFVVRNDQAVPAEPNTTDEAMSSPRVLLTTFQNRSALAALMTREFSQAAQVDSSVERQALAITAGLTSERDIASSLYRWVRDHLRYEDWDLAANGITPHRADSVLRRGSGDCKDFATLYAALLQARGISSVPVLISTLPNFTLSELPVLQDFNHVVTYIPSLDTYVDTTSKGAAFGAPLWYAAGKPVMHLTGSTASVRTLPVAETGSTTNMSLKIGPNGHVTVQSKTRTTGAARMEALQASHAMAGQDLSAILQRSLLTRGLGSPQGTMAFVPAPDQGSIEFVMRFEAIIPPLQQNPVALRVGPYFHNNHTLAAVAEKFRAALRVRPFGCAPEAIEESGSIILPPGASGIDLPAPVDYRDGGIAYEARYILQDGEVRMTRRFTNAEQQSSCDPSRYGEYHQAALLIAKDLSSTINYQMPSRPAP